MTSPITLAILAALILLALGYAARWWSIERRRAAGRQPGPVLSGLDTLIGFVTNFFDTLGIGSFATTTATYKLLRRMPDELIPGTLNAGHALPIMAMALIFIATVEVEPVTLIGMIGAATAGAWVGVGFVSRLARRAIQIGMGVALLIAACLFLASLLGAMPGGGAALGLSGGKLVFAVAASFLLGMLMMLGIGFYAPCLILVSLLGMNPLAAFPIMMGACAFLTPVGGARFIATGGYDLRAALGLAVGGIFGVLVAAYIVKSLPLDWLRWLVVIVVAYTGIVMLASARRGKDRTAASA